MKEKKLLRWIMICFAVLILLYVAATTVINIASGDIFTEESNNLTQALQDPSREKPIVLEELQVEVEDPGLVTFLGFEEKEGTVYWSFAPEGHSSGKTIIMVTDASGETLECTRLIVRKDLIMDESTANFTNYRKHEICMAMLLVGFSALLWTGYAKASRELVFSHLLVFFSGLGIWVSLVAVVFIGKLLAQDMMLNVYHMLAGSAGLFSTYMFPLATVFAILLTASNISLIRHEGFRFTNALGIILSCMMIFGFFALLLYGNIISSGNEFTVKFWDTATEFLQTIYALLECFLIGSIIAGTKAAKNRPAYDKDCIVILGCMIRDDGGLYPLIRGRVDRAIAFYKEQLAATGKKAVFIPSGGQGSDEPISEGEAMARYLLEQGIEPEQIRPETKSVNTKENMLFSKAIAGEDAKAVFSTTNYHVFRSGIVAREAGFEAEGMGAPTKWYFWPNAYVREVVGMLSYTWKSLVVLLLFIATYLTVIRFSF